MLEEMRYRCINYSHVLRCCQLLVTNGLLIDKNDLIKNCDGFKLPSQCSWFKDMEYADYV